MKIKNQLSSLKSFFRKSDFFSRPAVIAITFVGMLSACTQAPAKKQSIVVWNKNLPVIGSQSSPRTADLNKDGTLDIIIGAGKNEFQESDMGILAFDGRSGELL